MDGFYDIGTDPIMFEKMFRRDFSSQARTQDKTNIHQQTRENYNEKIIKMKKGEDGTYSVE